MKVNITQQKTIRKLVLLLLLLLLLFMRQINNVKAKCKTTMNKEIQHTHQIIKNRKQSKINQIQYNNNNNNRHCSVASQIPVQRCTQLQTKYVTM